MKKIKIVIASIIAMIGMSFILNDNAHASQLAKTCVQDAGGSDNVTKTGKESGCADANPLAEKIEGVVKTMTGLVGAFAVGMIVYGGFKYITSQGDPKAAESAKNIIWYAGVGLFIVLLAFMVFNLIINALGAENLNTTTGS